MSWIMWEVNFPATLWNCLCNLLLKIGYKLNVSISSGYWRLYVAHTLETMADDTRCDFFNHLTRQTINMRREYHESASLKDKPSYWSRHTGSIPLRLSPRRDTNLAATICWSESILAAPVRQSSCYTETAASWQETTQHEREAIECLTHLLALSQG